MRIKDIPRWKMILYISFLGPSPSVISGEKIQTCTNDAILRSRFFPENTLGDGPSFWIFLGFTDKGLTARIMRIAKVSNCWYQLNSSQLCPNFWFCSCPKSPNPDLDTDLDTSRSCPKPCACPSYSGSRYPEKQSKLFPPEYEPYCMALCWESNVRCRIRGHVQGFRCIHVRVCVRIRLWVCFLSASTEPRSQLPFQLSIISVKNVVHFWNKISNENFLILFRKVLYEWYELPSFNLVIAIASNGDVEWWRNSDVCTFRMV